MGQIIGQLAKRKCLTVVGSVGCDDKLKFAKDALGFNAVFNYKSESPAYALVRTLKELGKEGIYRR